jgi:SAM-dependent methyltransferase
MPALTDTLLYARLRHLAKKALGRPTVPPPVNGVADSAWYDAAYQTLPGYAVPFFHSHYYAIWTVICDRVRRDGLKRVVDIGCGPGQFARCLFTLGEITQYDGLDFSPQAVEMAKKACPQGRFVVGDATTTTLCRDVDHDVVICMEVLEHVPADEDVIRRWRTGTRAICTVPNFEYPSHVRHFRTADEVRDRYGRFFDGLDVFPILAHHAPHNVFYLLDGVRNGR